MLKLYRSKKGDLVFAKSKAAAKETFETVTDRRRRGPWAETVPKGRFETTRLACIARGAESYIYEEGE